MKAFKYLILLIVVAFCFSSCVVRRGPGWIPGHYNVGPYGGRVWVPGHYS